jgi:hypothetical protein
VCFAATLNFLRSAISSCRTTSQGNNSLIGNCVSLRARKEADKAKEHEDRFHLAKPIEGQSGASAHMQLGALARTR